MTAQMTCARVAFFSLLMLTTLARAGEWVNALKPAGKTAPPMTIVAGGIARYAILLPAKPTAPEQKAAADLQEWFKQISGTSLPIATEDRKPEGVARFISIGNTQLLAQSAGGDAKELGDDG